MKTHRSLVLSRSGARGLLSLASLAAVLALLLVTRAARAEPWFGWGDNAIEDRYLDDDLDVEDLVEGTRVGRSGGGSQQVRVGTWLTVGAFARTALGKLDVGTMVLVGVAFDRIAQGPSHRIDRLDMASRLADGPPPHPHGAPSGSASAAPPSPPAPAPSATSSSPPVARPPLLVTPGVARQAVIAAWRTSGIGTDDARIDSMIARARESAALPETRLRVMKVVNDTSHLGVIPTDTSTYDIAGANLYFEGRLTWRLDRLLYADDEPGLERNRLERQDARERISARVIDTLFQWQRAWVADRGALAGSKESIDAAMRLAEARAALDVLTGGWFSGWVARQDAAAGQVP